MSCSGKIDGVSVCKICTEEDSCVEIACTQQKILSTLHDTEAETFLFEQLLIAALRGRSSNPVQAAHDCISEHIDYKKMELNAIHDNCEDLRGLCNKQES